MDFTKLTDEELQNLVGQGNDELRRRTKEKEDRVIEQFYKAWKNLTDEGLTVFYDERELFFDEIDIQ